MVSVAVMARSYGIKNGMTNGISAAAPLDSSRAAPSRPGTTRVVFEALSATVAAISKPTR